MLILVYGIQFALDHKQQQRQPGTAGTSGCSFFYQIIDKCPTQLLIPITNIHMENVTMLGGLTMPGVILCNETVPCMGFTWDNVNNFGDFIVQDTYVCENVEGSTFKSNPSPACF